MKKKLASYKETNPDFYYSVLDCIPIENLGDEVLEDATWNGHVLTCGDEKFYTDEGIRGISKGTFYVSNGNIYKLVSKPDWSQLNIISEILKEDRNIKAELDHNWYKHQIEKLK